MTIAETLLPEFDQEMATTRRLLARVPTDKGQWKPHPKSFALGHLAQLVAWMPGWIANTVRHTALDLATAPKYSFETRETLLREFDTNVRAAREALSSSQDADYAVPWSLKHGDRALFTAPRGTVVRTPHQSLDPSSGPAQRVSALERRARAADLRADGR